MTTPNTINEWNVVTNLPHGYLAPECRYVRLSGEVEGRGELLTGWIVAMSGEVVETLSGSLYRLGESVTPEARTELQEAFEGLGGISGYSAQTLAYLLRG